MKPTPEQSRGWRSEVVGHLNTGYQDHYIASAASVWAYKEALGRAHAWIAQNVDKATADRFKRDLDETN